MSAELKLPRMTVPEFLAWSEEREGRFELEGGVVVAMSPEVNRHLRTKGAVYLALTEAVRSAGLPCTALPDGATVRIDDTSAYEPDALVYCGPQLPDDAVEFEPVVVIEVLSPSTARRDLTDKLAGYFRVPSVQHYLIIDAERDRIIHHRRGREDEVATRIVSEGTITLEPPGLTLAVTDLLVPTS